MGMVRTAGARGGPLPAGGTVIMATTAKLTLEQFLALPETKPGCEYLDGEVVQKTMPSTAHMFIQHLLSLVIGAFLRDHPLGIAGPEWRCVFDLPDRQVARLPDFAFVRWEHLKADSWNSPHHGPPDLAVEILSPDDRPGDVTEKIVFYLMSGVALVWLIDPDARTVRVFTPAGGSRLLCEEDTLDGGDVLPGFATAVHAILPPPGPLDGPPAQA